MRLEGNLRGQPYSESLLGGISFPRMANLDHVSMLTGSGGVAAWNRWRFGMRSVFSLLLPPQRNVS